MKTPTNARVRPKLARPQNVNTVPCLFQNIIFQFPNLAGCTGDTKFIPLNQPCLSYSKIHLGQAS